MLRTIKLDQLRLGMFVTKFEGSWFDHPFWRSKFMLSSAEELATLKQSNLEAIVIDTDKGLDIATAAPPPPPAPTGRMRTAATFGQAKPLAPWRAPPPPRPSFDPMSREIRTAEQEFGTASRVLGRSKRSVEKIFADSRLGAGVKIAKIEPVVEEISMSVLRNPHALASIVRFKNADDYTYMHSIAVCALMISFARFLKLDPALEREIGLAGLMHDLGMVAVDPEILATPGPLDATGMAAVRAHPAAGLAMLEQDGAVSDIVRAVCLEHHEKVDGTGYPAGLVGTGISLYARMAAICDVYDALTSDRPYRPAMDPAEALALMTEQSAHFDLELFSAFVRSMGIYPIGSLVKLESDRLAIVAEQNREDYTRPIVRAFYSTHLRKRVATEDIDLSSSYGADKIVCREHPSSWQLDPWPVICAKLMGKGFKPG